MQTSNNPLLFPSCFSCASSLVHKRSPFGLGFSAGRGCSLTTSVTVAFTTAFTSSLSTSTSNIGHTDVRANLIIIIIIIFQPHQQQNVFQSAFLQQVKYLFAFSLQWTLNTPQIHEHLLLPHKNQLFFLAIVHLTTFAFPLCMCSWVTRLKVFTWHVFSYIFSLLRNHPCAWATNPLWITLANLVNLTITMVAPLLPFCSGGRRSNLTPRMNHLIAVSSEAMVGVPLHKKQVFSRWVPLPVECERSEDSFSTNIGSVKQKRKT